MSSPEFISVEMMKKLVPGLARGVELVLVSDRLYKRDDGEWRRLDDKPLDLRGLIADAKSDTPLTSK